MAASRNVARCPAASPEKAATRRRTPAHRALIESATQHTVAVNPLIGARRKDVLGAATTLLGRLAREPRVVTANYAKLIGEYGRIATGRSTLAPAQGDRRFADRAWQDNALFRRVLQSYMALGGTLDRCVDQAKLGARDTERARFAMSLLVDALAPTNFLASNPAALRKLVDTKGVSVLRGFANLIEDVASGTGLPRQVDARPYAVGRNLATTPGAVVYRNELLELIQYAPTTPQVHARPLLIVPPQINKFYVFDLVPEKSLVRFALNGGLQTFAISWKNPTAAERQFGLDTYVAALEDAVDVIREITGSEDVNIWGSCSGGITMSAFLANLAARGERKVHSATVAVCVLDMAAAKTTTAGIFATPESIAAAKHASQVAGLVEGRELARMFAWLRPNDLVWSYWVNNYLLGNAPPAVDLLYWNNDSTRLPARFHAQLLDLFVDDLFRRPGALTVLGAPIDLAKVTCDKYVVAGITDHITPWPAGYRAAKLFGGATDFVLSSSGHIQSILNPPGNPKAKFFVNPGSPDDPQAWLKGATTCAGSWWTHWRDWLTARSGDLLPAPDRPGSDHFPRLADAPGTYVLEH